MAYLRLRKCYKVFGISESFARWFSDLPGSDQRTLLALGEHLLKQAEQGNLTLAEPREIEDENKSFSIYLDISAPENEHEHNSLFVQSPLFKALKDAPHAAETAYRIERAVQTLMQFGLESSQSLPANVDMTRRSSPVGTELSEYEAMEGMIASRRQAGARQPEESRPILDTDLPESVEGAPEPASEPETHPEPEQEQPKPARSEVIRNSLKGMFD